MTRPTLLAAATLALAPAMTSGFVELSFEVNGSNLVAHNFTAGLDTFGHYNPFQLDVRLRGDQPISGITWNWLVGGDWPEDAMKYASSPAHGALFGAAYYVGAAQLGESLNTSAHEGYQLETSPRWIAAPYDAIIASYVILRWPDDGFYPSLTISATSRDVPLQWSYTHQVSGTFPPQYVTEHGVPETIPLRFLNTVPDPSTTLLLMAAIGITLRRRVR